MKSNNTKLVTRRPTLKTLSHKQIKTTIYIKSSTPYISALKRTKKFLANLRKNNSKYVSLMGMGKAVEKTLAIGCYFQNEKGNGIDIITKTVEVIDELMETESMGMHEDAGVQDVEEQSDDDRETFLKKGRLVGLK
ncbi:ribonuclease P/MRP protein subunit POP7 KNAG_0A03830 [Huiozyma naganishii CBS 8797]|uniref:Uncharacterized protein n=1 Tax=Huiozyma naganishii (strain ATCC MYA-139 / BCRC 22969 / CBS 8797 / KCTC 17520 / NBRC 10181 / NCYC 3082 / Yp74L-3) TaxID=1071383 RepID=J7RES8_HUIN7|nr:hypothetical protein KNAG_0A03830 [Kazachstania naganishii CBS 8797]CCK68063.1 hypothetical protein KNAG_0A03830 [Kazachstania naganishii CBS 8797]